MTRLCQCGCGQQPPMTEKFDPDWCIHPGATLQDWIDENHLSVRMAATICGRMEEHRLQRIIDGSLPITPVIACKLQAGTSIPASLWLNLEKHFRAGLKAGKKWTK